MTNTEDLQASFAALRNASPPPKVDVADRVIAAIRAQPARRSSVVGDYTMLISAALCAIAASVTLMISSLSESASTTVTNTKVTDANDVVRSAYEIDLPSLLQ